MKIRNKNPIDYIKNIDELISILLKSDKYKKERIVLYLRVYTDILLAYSFFKMRKVKNCIYNLKKAQKTLSVVGYPDEKKYIERLRKLIVSVLEILKQKEDESIYVSYKMNANFRSLQGMCILRILKIS
jgi:UDP-N-acetylglucosamine 2-epimerase